VTSQQSATPCYATHQSNAQSTRSNLLNLS